MRLIAADLNYFYVVMMVFSVILIKKSQNYYDSSEDPLREICFILKVIRIKSQSVIVHVSFIHNTAILLAVPVTAKLCQQIC